MHETPVDQSLLAGNESVKRADELEGAMLDALGIQVKLPWVADVSKPCAAQASGRYLMGDDPRLPKMPTEPTLMDFFRLRVSLDSGACAHLLQSARLARQRGESDNIVLAATMNQLWPW